MDNLFASLSHPVVEVFFLAVALRDQLFINLKTEDDWKPVHDVKVNGLQVLLEAVDPASLDFLVLTSSIATPHGSPGQANYSAAQVEMEMIGAQLPNWAVSVAVPPNLDAGILKRSMGSSSSRNAALEKYKFFGVSTRRLVQYCFDAILSLDSKPHNPVYIPALEWKILLESGMVPDRSRSLVCHLSVKDTDENFSSGASHEGTIRAICAKVLSLNVEEMDETTPLSSYGLDSLTAARLKGILKAIFNVEVTQLQLLSTYMTVEKLLSMQTQQAALEAENLASNDEDASAAANKSIENEMDQTVVSLNDVNCGPPVFFIHGAGGGVLVLHKIAQKIQVPVYGVQDTPEAPLTGTIHDLATFYLEQIKKKQPTGPYRLGGFSFGTVVAFIMALMLRKSGEIVEMLIFLDGAPSLYHRPSVRDYIRQTILDGSMADNIMQNVRDMATSGALDEAQDIITHFEEYFEHKGQERKWVARFCQAYSAHLLMGIRESADRERLEQNGEYEGLKWPAEWTVLMKARNGAQMDPHTQGSSEAFDLDKTTDKVQIFEFPGTHFGLLNPASGVCEALNTVLCR
ncbi:hypothetical protein GYMLUDRAFT_241886 [Collybiopsis luxurians FD-317 M1]|uniref:Unplaced genomic scaffold GYMLUscaffold_16, whole genome shotgun sequence n=1 Tax=Collybiopsis luxurians FD-317 M1 TaxID=944289 RepID=A0A0D0CUX8_9AGAR|nr:hypothetical protein GYMLUDRAFT_241886 [Collybiopsis luxurians FD-317 M1]